LGFKVYYDCSVEFVSSYGDPLITSIGELKNTSSITISPTLFNNELKIIRLEGGSNYTILEKELAQEKLLGNHIQKFGFATTWTVPYSDKSEGTINNSKIDKKVVQ